MLSASLFLSLFLSHRLYTWTHIKSHQISDLTKSHSEGVILRNRERKRERVGMKDKMKKRYNDRQQINERRETRTNSISSLSLSLSLNQIGNRNEQEREQIHIHTNWKTQARARKNIHWTSWLTGNTNAIIGTKRHATCSIFLSPTLSSFLSLSLFLVLSHSCA